MTELIEEIEAARAGDRDAFGRLVARFEAMAVGCAYARLRDADLSRDVAQEAFLGAFLTLPQLRDPAAFPGWLRRVILKHCDRQQRAPARRLAGGTLPRELPDPAPGAAHALETAERNARLRAAVEALPPAQRIVVVLHYFAGEPLEQIAGFLELPVTTLKKRLYTARRRIEMESLPMDAIETLASPLCAAGTTLSARVRLFLALRTGDRLGVASLLDQAPDLVHATEDWSVDDALDGGLPAPTRATPLIRAAERGDLAMLDLLLDRGAPTEAGCGCLTGETALFAALAAGRESAALRLLARGADPNASAFAGTTPLHVAAIRGFETLIGPLLERGADPSRRDANGRTAAEWAQHKGRATIAARLGIESAVLTCSTTTPSGTARTPLLVTGIKALDLFAPVVHGDLVRLIGGMQVGRNVLLAELCATLGRRDGGRAVYAAWERHAWQDAELEGFLSESGLVECVDLLRCPPDAPGDARLRLPEEALARAQAIRAATAAPVLLAIFEEAGCLIPVESLYPRLGRPAPAAEQPASPGPPAISVVLVAPLERSALEPPFQLARPFDALVRLDPALARAQRYPAIDPAWTRSRNLRPEIVGERHCIVSREARALLGRARELSSAGIGDEAPTRTLLARAHRLQAFLTQPFHVAESFTARPGAFVEVEDTVATVSEILAGQHDGLPIERMAYRGGRADLAG